MKNRNPSNDLELLERLLKKNQYTTGKKHTRRWPTSDMLALCSLIATIVGVVIALFALPEFNSIRPLFRPILAIKSELWFSCPGGVVLPQSVDPQNLSSKAKDIIQKSLDRVARGGQDLPPLGQMSGIYAYLSNIAHDTTQLAIDSTVILSVRHEDISDNINVISFGGCGAGFIKSIDYNDIPLSVVTSTLKRRIEYNDKSAKYISLQAGETEPFHFYFKCVDPGIYSIDIDVNYAFSGQTHSANLIRNANIVCPKSFTRWDPYTSKTWLQGHLSRFQWDHGFDNNSVVYAQPKKDAKILATIIDEKQVTLSGDYTVVDGVLWAYVKINPTGVQGWVMTRG